MFPGGPRELPLAGSLSRLKMTVGVSF